MNGDIKIGRLLCDEDIITKRQLNQALQMQVKGDKRTLGEILVDRGFCSLEDITEVILKHGNGHEEKQEDIVEKVKVQESNKGFNIKDYLLDDDELTDKERFDLYYEEHQREQRKKERRRLERGAKPIDEIMKDLGLTYSDGSRNLPKKIKKK